MLLEIFTKSIFRMTTPDKKLEAEFPTDLVKKFLDLVQITYEQAEEKIIMKTRKSAIGHTLQYPGKFQELADNLTGQELEELKNHKLLSEKQVDAINRSRGNESSEIKTPERCIKETVDYVHYLITLAMQDLTKAPRVLAKFTNDELREFVNEGYISKEQMDAIIESISNSFSTKEEYLVQGLQLSKEDILALIKNYRINLELDEMELEEQIKDRIHKEVEYFKDYYFPRHNGEREQLNELMDKLGGEYLFRTKAFVFLKIPLERQTLINDSLLLSAQINRKFQGSGIKRKATNEYGQVIPFPSQ